MIESLKSIAFRSGRVTGALRALRAASYWFDHSPHERDFSFLRHASIRPGLFLDLGANLGQSATSALKIRPDFTALSLEPNRACEPGLRLTKWLLRGRMDFRMCGVGFEPGELDFFVPRRSSRLLTEEGTFDLASLDTPASVRRIGRRGVDYEVLRQRLPVVSVDSLEVNPVVVKLDLQGFELAALKGMQRTLRSHRPVLLVEVGPDRPAIEAFLAAELYRGFAYDGRHLGDPLTLPMLNEIFLPEESVDSFVE